MILLQRVQSGRGDVGACVVVMQQQAAGASVWRACVLSLYDSRQADFDVRLSIDSLPLLERDRLAVLSDYFCCL